MIEREGTQVIAEPSCENVPEENGASRDCDSKCSSPGRVAIQEGLPCGAGPSLVSCTGVATEAESEHDAKDDSKEDAGFLSDVADVEIVWSMSGKHVCFVPVHAEATVLEIKVQLVAQLEIDLDELGIFAQHVDVELQDTEYALGTGKLRTKLLLLRRDWRQVERSRLSLQRALHMGSTMDRMRAQHFLQSCIVTYQAGSGVVTQASRRYTRFLRQVWNLEVKGATKGLRQLSQTFLNLRSLKCHLEGPGCVITYPGYGFVRSFRHLRKLELRFDDEGTINEEEGLDPLVSLASSLQVLDIGNFYRGHAQGLHVLAKLVELKELCYSGANHTEFGPRAEASAQDVLDLRALTKLEQLIFEGTDFTAPYGLQASSLQQGLKMVDTIDDALRAATEYGPFGIDGFEILAQGLVPPSHLPRVIFRHLHLDRITPGLRRFLLANGCEPLEYFQEPVGTSPNWGLRHALQCMGAEPIDFEQDTWACEAYRLIHRWTGRWARFTGEQIENAERFMAEDRKRREDRRKQEQQERREEEDRRRAARQQTRDQQMKTHLELPGDATVCRICLKRLRTPEGCLQHMQAAHRGGTV